MLFQPIVHRTVGGKENEDKFLDLVKEKRKVNCVAHIKTFF